MLVYKVIRIDRVGEDRNVEMGERVLYEVVEVEVALVIDVVGLVF